MSTPRDDGGPAPADLLDRWLTNRGSDAASDAGDRPAHRAEGPPLTGRAAGSAALPSAVDRDLVSPAAEPAAPAAPPVAPARALEQSVFAAFHEARATENPPTAAPTPAPEPEPAPPAPDLSPTAAASPLVAAARSLEHQRAAAVLGVDEDPAVAPPATDVPASAAQPAAPADAGTRSRRVSAAPAVDEAPTTVEFGSSRIGQLTMSLLVLAGIVVTAGLGWAAYDSRATTDIALAGVAGVLTLVVWAVRAGAGSTRVTIDRGVLRVQRGSSSFSFDLTNVQLDVEENGTPGRRDWSFVIHRRSLGPVVIDKSLVDPERFMAAVRRYRRDV